MKVNGYLFFTVLEKEYYTKKRTVEYKNNKESYERGYCEFIRDTLVALNETHDFEEIKKRINRAYDIKSEGKNEFSKGYFDALNMCYELIHIELE